MPTGDNPRRGPEHGSWKGDAATKKAGRLRARNLYKLGPCEHCGKPATDRHHKDDNPLNNHPDNVEILCRRCHMIADGRLKKFVSVHRYLQPVKPPSPCIICDRMWKPLRKGRCHACDLYLRYHGVERPPEVIERWRRIHPTMHAKPEANE
jgi:hypothetical protein